MIAGRGQHDGGSLLMFLSGKKWLRSHIQIFRDFFLGVGTKNLQNDPRFLELFLISNTLCRFVNLIDVVLS